MQAKVAVLFAELRVYSIPPIFSALTPIANKHVSTTIIAIVKRIFFPIIFLLINRI